MEEERTYRTLYGTMAARSKIVAWCRLHKVHLTAQQVKMKQCSQKGCDALKKWDCPYWDRKTRVKEIKQMKKEAGIPAYRKVKVRTGRDGKTVVDFQKGE